jgi:signal transduction histidine kinase
VDLESLIEEIASEYRTTHPGARIEVVVEASQRGPWDPERIKQLLSNLLANALQNSTGDSPVQLRVSAEAQRARIEVTNHGPAIPEAIRERPFDAFHASPHGLGLGLFIVDQIARAHGGDVAFDSTDGKTVFTVRLPYRPSMAPAAERHP